MLGLVLLALPAACGADDAPLGPSQPRPVVFVPGEVHPDGTISVHHERELRGAWVSTVYNGTWPSRTGLTESAAKAELIGIFDALAGARMNVVFFQVRAESDAFYASTLEPWSRFLTGTQGQDPGWDPLTFAVEEGHRRGLEVHAWLNPYRALVDARITPAASHVTNTLATATRAYGTQRWMDPGAPEVRAHVMNVVRDIVARYDVDGIHFDDYFYPYPISGETFDDAATFAAHETAGGALTRDDWRRSNVDALIRETADVVAATRADVRFGVSPFGIYRPGMPEGITGLDAWATLFCDPVRWMQEGWVDYVAPQLYWPTTQRAQAFGKLAEWWAGLATERRSVFIGHDATKAGEAKYPLDEYDAQMTVAYEQRARGVRGSIFFSAKPLVSDQAGLRTALVAEHWKLPAAPPPLATASAHTGEDPPRVAWVTSDAIEIMGEGRSSAIYREREASDAAADSASPRYVLERLVPLLQGRARLELDRGSWVVTRISRVGGESRGVRVSRE